MLFSQYNTVGAVPTVSGPLSQWTMDNGIVCFSNVTTVIKGRVYYKVNVRRTSQYIILKMITIHLLTFDKSACQHVCGDHDNLHTLFYNNVAVGCFEEPS
jgi:hypothetical protein